VPRARHAFGETLPALKSCDFAQTVLVPSDTAVSQPAGARPGTARVVGTGANHVTVELDGSAGWLVLSEVWFPGWTCRVDGAEVEVVRANHAFRAVPVPAGARGAEFRFAPRSYRIGWWVSAVALALVLVLALTARLRGSRARTV
ncbi:MAG TPA: YfhO family protein, partial [Gemmata sp.]